MSEQLGTSTDKAQLDLCSPIKWEKRPKKCSMLRGKKTEDPKTGWYCVAIQEGSGKQTRKNDSLSSQPDLNALAKHSWGNQP